MNQLTLPGFEPPRWAPVHRLFFAAMPDPHTAASIAAMAGQLCAEMGVTASLLHTERLHMTLHHLGDFVHLPEVMVARACVAAASIDVPPFDVTFDRISSFNGRQGHWPLVLTGSSGLDELTGFQQGLGNVLRKVGLRASRARFSPHLTLTYDERRFEARAIEPITWAVREFVLIDSWHGKTHYDIKGRWALGGRVSPASA